MGDPGDVIKLKELVLGRTSKDYPERNHNPHSQKKTNAAWSRKKNVLGKIEKEKTSVGLDDTMKKSRSSQSKLSPARQSEREKYACERTKKKTMTKLQNEAKRTPVRTSERERERMPENYLFTIPLYKICLLYTSPSPRDLSTSRMPSSA